MFYDNKFNVFEFTVKKKECKMLFGELLRGEVNNF